MNGGIGWLDRINDEAKSAGEARRRENAQASDSYRGGTWTRPTGSQYGVENVRCSRHSEFDGAGFAIQRPTDPEGARCWAPVVGRECEECGVPT